MKTGPSIINFTSKLSLEKDGAGQNDIHVKLKISEFEKLRILR